MPAAADALLKPYREKRDFSKTAEPDGRKRRTKAKTLFFCIQKHDATRLHYDFRIEWGGVLKSWAVTKGPSLDPADKRLAVRTEDHPMDYGDFEGTIPKGQYGGGTVMLWDRGSWEPVGDAEAGLADGNLKMLIHGEKLTGHWALIRMKPRKGEKSENWLLIKEKDEVATSGRDLLAEFPDSVKTGRDLKAIAEGNGAVWQSDRAAAEADVPAKGTGKARTGGAQPKSGRSTGKAATGKTSGTPTKRRAAAGKPLALPDFRPVQLATLVDEAPAGDDWLHEMKYDGYRVLIAVAGEKHALYTRNQHDWTEKFAGLVPAVEGLPCRSALIDGEVVAFDEDGRTDFSTLQLHLSEGGDIACFCFDLLELDGEDLTGLPLTARKERLEALLKAANQPLLLYSEHIRGRGPSVYRSICASDHEGIVSKRADDPYRGSRTKSWLKVKCKKRQEFVIGGFAPSDKKSRPFSSILLGVNERGKLLYRGRVGSGFDQDMLVDLKKRFDAIARKTSPFDALDRTVARSSRFVEPRLVAEIEFAEITADGSVRHGVFKGLREDKEAQEVVDETPADPGDTAKTKQAARSGGRAPAATAKGGHPSAAPRAARGKSGDAVVAGVKLSHPDRVLYEAHGVTKLDLARYYEAAAERMLTYAGDRPVSLVRCPAGGKQCFFQKHDTGGFPDTIKKVPVAEKEGGTEDYLYFDSAEGLVAAIQMNTMEFHLWGARNDRLEKPDRLVFDLDPDEGLGFADVKRAAIDIRDVLAEIGLQTFPMVTGGEGVHIVAPLDRRADWPAVKAFARGFATTLVEHEPTRFIATMSKAKRKGLIFVDWLRNERGSTAIAPYSTRSREGAPVATPVSWEEFETLDRANGFDIEAVLERLGKPDPWDRYATVKQGITKARLRAVGAEA
ncbi:DNA ligase D [Aurantimonas sp. MSK8Z-1]|uniref:DNA ligase D n=1 Tax=Mangrovibrevibacter kandeliae TaxID=2968473 RepID=UPI002117BA6A|nr:DNA ligase D [Aurantimonas sp. MSK8Z-1]MCW4113900.1 DNA ligase D [Aurantimonas sp. MSK8Z-1]